MRSFLRLAGALPLLALCFVASGRLLAADRLETDPPNLLFSEKPALLILIDGEPVYRPVEGTDLERVINTKPFIVRDSTGMHYLKVFDGWMETYMLQGMWSVSGVAPRGVEQALEQAIAAKAVDLLNGARPGQRGGTPALNDGTAPVIFISTEPAELIVTDGPARFATVKGTRLQYVVNTTAHVFKEPTDDELYVLIAGRWFRSWRFDGPWELVPSHELPADIAAIPDNSPLRRQSTAAAAPKGSADRR